MQPEFIVIDGNQGAGTSTQIAHLEMIYPRAYYVSEPKHAFLASAHTLSRKKYTDQMWRMRRLFIESAYRRFTARKMVCDSFDVTTYAHFVYGRKNEAALERDFITARKEFLGPYRPVHYFILIAKAEVAARRIGLKNGTESTFDPKRADAQKRIIQGYKTFRDLFPHEVTLIDANGSVDSIQADLVKLTRKFLLTERQQRAYTHDE